MPITAGELTIRHSFEAKFNLSFDDTLNGCVLNVEFLILFNFTDRKLLMRRF